MQLPSLRFRFSDVLLDFDGAFFSSKSVGIAIFHSDWTRLNSSMEALASSTESCSCAWMRRPNTLNRLHFQALHKAKSVHSSHCGMQVQGYYG